MPYWNNKKTRALQRAFQYPYRRQMTFSNTSRYHLGKSRSILSRYKNPAAKVSVREFRALERKVRKNESEIHSIRINGAQKLHLVNNVWEQTNVDLTAAITGGNLFREHVLGDKFHIKGMTLNMTSECRFVRVIIYRPHKTSNILDLDNQPWPINFIYDKSIVKSVYLDHKYVRNANGSTLNDAHQKVLNKPIRISMPQIINSDNNDVIESPPLRMLILQQGAAGDQTRYSYELMYQNK